jgi:hypothetical protein
MTHQAFIETAREMGCDPDDPRGLDVLKRLAATPPKRREKGGRERHNPSGSGKSRK